MTTIQAWQHIYSNVEKEQSPQGRGGFQTLFYTTSGLTEAEIEEMEGRLLYFASKVEPVKRLFFATSTGKGVVSEIVFLPNPDQFGRGGRYLAHSLIFAPEDLTKFEADPFRVFGRFSFVTSVDEALKQGNFQTGDIPAVSLELPATATTDVEAAAQWPVPELKKLALFALRVDQQAREREALTFTGESQQIESALAAAFLAVPVSMRPRCSFDTYFYRCNLVATYFWAIGLPEPPVSVKFVHVEGQSREVQGETPGQPETAYERWTMQRIETGKLADIARYRDNAFALGEWLDDRAYDLSLLNAAPSNLIEDVLKASPLSVQAALRRGIVQKLPSELVDRAADYVFQKMTGAALYKQLRQGFEVPPLLDILYESYAAEDFKEPPKQEIKALDPLLEKNDHKMLHLFLAYWASPRNELPKALKWAEEGDYHRFGEIALRLNLVEPFRLLIPGRGDAFLDIYLASNRIEVPELVDALMEAEEFDCVSRLTNYVPKLSPKELKKLHKLIDDQAEIPQPFQQAVAKAIAALPPETGLKAKLKSLFGRE